MTRTEINVSFLIKENKIEADIFFNLEVIGIYRHHYMQNTASDKTGT